MELAAAWVIVWLITLQLENSHHDVHHFQVNLYMYKQLKITLIINKLLLGLKELILILYSTLFWYSYYYIYLYVCLYIHECICIDAHAHVHTHVTLCEYVSTSATVKHGCTTLRMLYDVWKAVCCKYGNKLDLIWFDLILFPPIHWNHVLSRQRRLYGSDFKTLRHIASNLQYKSHQIATRKYLSSRLVILFAPIHWNQVLSRKRRLYSRDFKTLRHIVSNLQYKSH